jgi:signal transduction histidine kinase
MNSVKINLYRIMQESLQNIKYANANTIKIDLKKNDDLVLVISDNGRGFDAK